MSFGDIQPELTQPRAQSLRTPEPAVVKRAN